MCRLFLLMKNSYRLLIVTLLTAFLLNACDSKSEQAPTVEVGKTYRFATFNIAMGLENYGDMAAALTSGEDSRLLDLAKVLQIVRPEVVLLAEFDYDPAVDAAELLNSNYLQNADEGLQPISYAYSFRPTVNTGAGSGLDIDQNGKLGDPGDAWGFGRFPGQYGMLILSMHPIDVTSVRSFQSLLWKDLPDAHRPVDEGGQSHYPDEIWNALRLSSKNHVDLPIDLDGKTVHFLVSHPTPPVFDGPEDRNGKRNHDEIALWSHFISQDAKPWMIDDIGQAGGLAQGADFIIAGDLNADPVDGDANPGAIDLLLKNERVDSSCIPTSRGGAEATETQAGINLQHDGNPAQDTSDFNDETVGNYRLDYVLPSSNLNVEGCGVFWPASDEPHHGLTDFSDHRLVWLDIAR